MGLLQKTINLSNTQKISFEQFTKKYNLSLCAVLTKQNQDFVVTHSNGFDSISIISSVSSMTFWEGTIKEKNKWYSYTNNAQMLPFYQFFSFNQKDRINSIHINYLNNDRILIICSKDDLNFSDSSIINDFNSIDFNIENKVDVSEFSISHNENAEKYILDFTTAVENQIKIHLRKEEFSKIIKNAIYNEIANTLKAFFSEPNFSVKVSEGIFHVLYITDKELPLDLFTVHIKNSFKTILDDQSKLIEVTSDGKAASFKDLLFFLQVQ